MHRVPLWLAIFIEISLIICHDNFKEPDIWYVIGINGVFILYSIFSIIHDLGLIPHINEKKHDKKLNKLTNSSEKEKKKVLKIHLITFCFISLIIGVILTIVIMVSINNTTTSLDVPAKDNNWFLNYQGHWECVDGEQNRYFKNVYGAWVYRYDLLLEDSDGFVLVKQSYFYKQYNNGNYEPTALSTKNEIARGIIITEGTNVYLYFTEIDFETLDLSDAGLKNVTAINDYGFRPGDKTRILVTSNNYNTMTIYTPDGEKIFKK